MVRAVPDGSRSFPVCFWRQVTPGLTCDGLDVVQLASDYRANEPAQHLRFMQGSICWVSICWAHSTAVDFPLPRAIFPRQYQVISA